MSEPQYTGVRVVVPISGGKDSQACLKLALGSYSRGEVLGLFCDTNFEHPLTYKHLDTIRSMYGVRIHTVSAGNVPDKVLKYGRFPGGGARFCTDELKIIPGKKFYKALAESQGHGFEVWYGVRGSESPERAKRYKGKVSDEVYTPHEFMSKYPKYLETLGVAIRLPIVDWSTAEVLEFLAGEENPLYGEGFDRVGCFPCLAGGDASKIKAFEFDTFGAKQYANVQVLEKAIGKSVFRSGIGPKWEQEGNGCSFCSM